MGKLRQLIRAWMDSKINRMLEQAFQRTADKQNRKIYDKHKVKYSDGDNT